MPQKAYKINQNTKEKISWESPKRGFYPKGIGERAERKLEALALGGFEDSSLPGNQPVATLDH